MLRDIDYAAKAVQKAIVEKFGREHDLDDLEVVANERTITVRHGDHEAEDTRDNLLAALRKATTYDEFYSAAQQIGERPR